MKKFFVLILTIFALFGIFNCAQDVINYWNADKHPFGMKVATLMTQANYNELVDKRVSKLEIEQAKLQDEVRLLKSSKR